MVNSDNDCYRSLVNYDYSKIGSLIYKVLISLILDLIKIM